MGGLDVVFGVFFWRCVGRRGYKRLILGAWDLQELAFALGFC